MGDGGSNSRLPKRIGLVGCVAKKDAVARPARDLYLSPLFRGRLAYVERTCDEWWILSALYGLVDPDQEIDPYDVTLIRASRGQRRDWSRRVLAALRAQGDLQVDDTVEIHAGVEYRDFGLVEGLRAVGCHVVVPTEGMRIGEQLGFYAASGRR